MFPALRRRTSGASSSCLLALLPFVLIAMALSWCGRVLGCKEEERATKDETRAAAALVAEEPRRQTRPSSGAPAVASGTPAATKAGAPKSGASPAVKPKPAPAAAQEPARTRHYLCRDGSTSPKCICGQKKNGCCSHHGGVAGCEP